MNETPETHLWQLEVGSAGHDVLTERNRHAQLGWTLEHDDQHNMGELSQAAVCYALATPLYLASSYAKVISKLWPWECSAWKPKSYRENLVRAGSFILAEIERLDRREK